MVLDKTLWDPIREDISLLDGLIKEAAGTLICIFISRACLNGQSADLCCTLSYALDIR